MSRSISARIVVLMAAFAAIAAACGPGGSATGGIGGTGAPATEIAGGAGTAAPGTAAPGGNATAGKACDLLSDQDIEDITGATVTEKLDNVADTVYANHCRWSLSAGEINLGIISPGGREHYDRYVAIITGLEAVDGLPADIATRQDLTGTIFAVKDDTLVDVFTIGVVAPDEDIVRRVLDNLGG
jgi:hypothetical protein